MDWDESKHPRVPEGTATGGQFASAGGFYFPRTDTRNRPSLTEAHVRAITRKHFGREMGRDDIAAASGGIPGAEVNFKVSPEGDAIGVSFVVRRDGPYAGQDDQTAAAGFRWVMPGKIENSSFTVREPFRGKGLGLEIFEAQVNAAARLGFKEIVTDAVGDSVPGSRDGGGNGAWTWARFGYNGSVSGATPNGERTLHELMSTPQGTEWWRQNRAAFTGTFDLREGSTSRRVLTEYSRAKKGKR
jgi:GNAT superfamily N-acetyltransferase